VVNVSVCLCVTQMTRCVCGPCWSQPSVTLPPVGRQSIVMTVSVCLSVCDADDSVRLRAVLESAQYNSAPSRGAEYCGECVCLCVTQMTRCVCGPCWSQPSVTSTVRGSYSSWPRTRTSVLCRHSTQECRDVDLSSMLHLSSAFRSAYT